MNFDPKFDTIPMLNSESPTTTLPLMDMAEPVSAVYQVPLASNGLYLVRLRAIRSVATDSAVKECAVHIDIGVASPNDEFGVLRTRVVKLPVVSDDDRSYGKPGHWYEQAVFIQVDEISNSLQVQLNENVGQQVQLIVNTIRLFFDKPNFEAIEKLLIPMEKKSSRVNGAVYNSFLGVGVALRHIAKRQSVARDDWPKLRGAIDVPKEFNGVAEPLIGVVGDDRFEELIARTFPSARIDENALPSVRDGAFDLIIIQNRAVSLIAPSSLQSQQVTFEGKLVDALLSTSTPIIELDSNGVSAEGRATVRALRNVQEPLNIDVFEHELSRFSPQIGNQWNGMTIAIPCASDLYQYSDFQALSLRLIESGFSLIVSESNYDHVVKRTIERFPKKNIKVYGRLSTVETAELFQNCGFVLLPGKSLRPMADMLNLASMAIMSGALPIVWAPQSAQPWAGMAEAVWGYRALHEYLTQYGSMLARERHWLKIFRDLNKRLRKGHFSPLLRGLSKGRWGNHAIEFIPSAEMICISKRPDNFSTILSNLDRQRYPNLGMHLIWNVPPSQAQYCIDMTRAANRRNLRVTVLDESNNIGACLNHGRQESVAEYWFKIDDDDYYGENYIEDMVMFYSYSQADSVGKSSAFVLFKSTGQIYLRNHSPSQMRRPLEKGKYFCGATLSGRRRSDLPEFSTTHRNSCDSHWVEKLQEKGYSVFLSDIFNYVICRGDLRNHTWQLADERLQKDATLVLTKPMMGWFDAE